MKCARGIFRPNILLQGRLRFRLFLVFGVLQSTQGEEKMELKAGTGVVNSTGKQVCRINRFVLQPGLFRRSYRIVFRVPSQNNAGAL